MQEVNKKRSGQEQMP
jgi:hypothetical protein